MFKLLLPSYKSSISMKVKEILHYCSLTFYSQPLLTISTCFSPKKNLELVRICIILVSIIFIDKLSFKPLK